ncbi:hypothetical protein C8Q79DRAFT_671212 [Trametes meyenii]|nr:hypothetical protein C8Q79DRAFT_671212 [Trametes meyenii]
MQVSSMSATQAERDIAIGPPGLVHLALMKVLEENVRGEDALQAKDRRYQWIAVIAVLRLRRDVILNSTELRMRPLFKPNVCYSLGDAGPIIARPGECSTLDIIFDIVASEPFENASSAWIALGEVESSRVAVTKQPVLINVVESHLRQQEEREETETIYTPINFSPDLALHELKLGVDGPCGAKGSLRELWASVRIHESLIVYAARVAEHEAWTEDGFGSDEEAYENREEEHGESDQRDGDEDEESGSEDKASTAEDDISSAGKVMSEPPCTSSEGERELLGASSEGDFDSDESSDEESDQYLSGSDDAEDSEDEQPTAGFFYRVGL